MATGSLNDPSRLINLKSSIPHLIRLLDAIDEHLGKSLALSAMLTLDDVFSLDHDRLAHYFWLLNDELWEINAAWQPLSEQLLQQP